MGIRDILTKKFVKRYEVFADIVNFALFDGAEVVTSDNLIELDPTMLEVISKNGDEVAKQKFRDQFMGATVDKERDVVYLFLGVENQTEICYEMVVRTLVYDALTYEDQVIKIAAENKKLDEEKKEAEEAQKIAKIKEVFTEIARPVKAVSEVAKPEEATSEVAASGKVESEKKSTKAPNNATHKKDALIGKLEEVHKLTFLGASEPESETSRNFTSRLRKGQKLLPVVTIVVYYGSEKWDAPVNFTDVLTIKHKEILPYIPQFKLALICPREIDDIDMAKFRTDMRQVMKVSKYMGDRNAVKQMIAEDSDFRKVSGETASVITALSGFKFEKIEGENNVYTVFDEIATHEVIVAKMESIKTFVEKGFLDSQFIADVLHMDEEYVKEAIAIYLSDDE